MDRVGVEVGDWGGGKGLVAKFQNQFILHLS